MVADGADAVIADRYLHVMLLLLQLLLLQLLLQLLLMLLLLLVWRSGFRV